MIVDVINDDVFSTSQGHIAFAINAEGYNGAFMQKIIKYAFGFSDVGKRQLGDMITIPTGLGKYYGIVCYSIENGWNDAPRILTNCLDKIETSEKETIALCLTEEEFNGTDVYTIIKAIHLSKHHCIVFTSIYSKETIFNIINVK